MSSQWISVLVVALGMGPTAPSGEPEASLPSELWSAVGAGDRVKVKRLVEASPRLAGIRNEEDVSLPLFALYHRRQEIADWLLRRKESLAPLDVFEAAAFGRVHRLREILRAEPELANAYAGDGFFPLGLAAFFGQEQAVKMLLARGADPNLAAHNRMKVRALHAAAASRSLSIAKVLIEAGADVNARQQAGFTPLQEAASNGQLELVRLLVDHGASLEDKAEDGRTALEMAREKNHPATVDFLTARGRR